MQSSNSVFILQPSESQEDGDAGPISVLKLSAVAECATSLEVIPSLPLSIELLKGRLALYTGPGALEATSPGLMDVDGAHQNKKGDIYRDTTVSTGEFDTAWKTLCAFEAHERSWRPTVLPLLAIWKSMMSAATLRSIKLEDSFPVAALTTVVEEDGHPLALLNAVVDRLAQQEKGVVDSCK